MNGCQEKQIGLRTTKNSLLVLPIKKVWKEKVDVPSGKRLCRTGCPSQPAVSESKCLSHIHGLPRQWSDEEMHTRQDIIPSLWKD